MQAERASKQALKEAENALQREKDNGSGKLWVQELGEARDRITELVAGAKTYLKERDDARQKRDDLRAERDQAYHEALEAKNHALREGASFQGEIEALKRQVMEADRAAEAKWARQLGQLEMEQKEKEEERERAIRDALRQEFQSQIWHLERELEAMRKERDIALRDAIDATNQIGTDADQAATSSLEAKLLRQRLDELESRSLQAKKEAAQMDRSLRECVAGQNEQILALTRELGQNAETLKGARGAESQIEGVQAEHDRVLKRMQVMTRLI